MTQSLTVRATSRPTEVDPRGPRFAAAITTLVLALVLVLATTVGGPRPARPPDRRVRDRRLRRSGGVALRPPLPTLRPPAAGSAGGAGGRTSAAVRAAGRTRLLAGRTRSGSSLVPVLGIVAVGVRARCRVPQRCLRPVPRLRGLPAHPPRPPGSALEHPLTVTPIVPLEGTAMSRTDALVDADWVEAHLDDPKIVLVEVDEDTTAYDKNHIRNAIKIDWKADLQDQVRRDFVNKAQFEALLSAQGHRQRRHRDPLRRQQQLVRVLRVLVLHALRPRGRQAARRRPQEVGARLA